MHSGIEIARLTSACTRLRSATLDAPAAEALAVISSVLQPGFVLLMAQYRFL